MGKYSDFALQADTEINNLLTTSAALISDKALAETKIQDQQARIDSLIKDKRALSLQVASLNDQLLSLTSGAKPWQSGDPTMPAPSGKTAVVGANFHGIWSTYTDATRDKVLDSLKDAGVKWVRLDIAWASLQPTSKTSYDLTGGVAKIDSIINKINARGMKVLLMIYWGPAWSTGTSSKNGVPSDPQDYANACAWAAGRWKGKVQAIELWNEPDLSDFLSNTSVAAWTGLVKAAYPKIKSANPDMIVVSGAPSALKDEWFKGFYANGGKGMCDVIGVHMYQGISNLSPTATPDLKYLQYWIANLPNIIKIMEANGEGNKKLWVTEYGWSSHDDSSYGTSVPSWKRGVTEAVQAQYLLEMQSHLSKFPNVEASFWYTERNTASGDVHEDNFGLMKADLSLKPAYYAMKCAASGVCGP